MKKAIKIGIVILSLIIFLLLMLIISVTSIVNANNNSIIIKESIKTEEDGDNTNIDYIDVNTKGLNHFLDSFQVTASTWNYPASFGGAWHPGIDLGSLGGTIGNPLYAPSESIVLDVRITSSGYGHHVTLITELDGKAYTFIFGHMNGFIVMKGDKLNQGDIFGYLGTTGSSSGPHVHVEIFQHNRSAKEVIAIYNNNFDYWFGLGYNSIGNCNDVCRLQPSQVYNYELGKIYNNLVK